MKFFHNMYFAFIVLIISVFVFGFSLYQYGLSGVSNDDTLKEIVIEPGTIDSIANTLYKRDLIKNKNVFKLYVKLSGESNLKAGTYSLSEDMSVQEIVKILSEGVGGNPNQIKVTFKEGINMRKLAMVIEENTNHTTDEVYALLKDKEYLRTLISKYWFLNDMILNENIYYSLEGYLYPNTYYFDSEDVSIESIFESMLKETESQLRPYKEQLQNSSMTLHQTLTLASIIELEGVTLEDRKGIAGVFLNRLDSNMTLGSDVTTYYGLKVDMGERDLYSSELKECNNYNTRCATFAELPISPICNPSIDSIISVLEPTNEDYYYFVADKNRKVYFSKNITEHNNTIANLKRQDLWYEY